VYVKVENFEPFEAALMSTVDDAVKQEALVVSIQLCLGKADPKALQVTCSENTRCE